MEMGHEWIFFEHKLPHSFVLYIYIYIWKAELKDST